MSMFNNIRVPQTIAALGTILADLADQPAVASVSLATADGVAIDTAPMASRTAAAAGFLCTAAQQTFTLLGLGESTEVVIYGPSDLFLVSRLFTIRGSRLVLTVVFNQPISYKRLLAHTIRSIQQMMEQ